MLNVDTIKNGLVIDHIKAGFGPQIFHFLGLDKADFSLKIPVTYTQTEVGP